MSEKVKILPYDVEVERSLLGAMIGSREALAEALYRMKSEDFYRDAHRYVFDALHHLSEEGEQIDSLMLAARLRDMGKLEAIGGTPYLEELLLAGALHYNVHDYVRIVREKSVRRQLLKAAKGIQQEATEQDDSKGALESAERMIFEISQAQSRGGLVKVSDQIPSITEEIYEYSKNPESVRGLKTGFLDLDAMTNGFQKSQLILIAARPSMGKSALGMNIVQHAALREEANVCVFSLEMSADQLIYRMLSSETNIPLGRLLTFQVQDQDFKKINYGLNRLNNTKLFIDDTPGISVMELRSKLRRHRMEHGPIDLIMIDYLQLMDGGGGENRQVEISNISRGLKAVAREFECPLIAISQLSRGPETRTNRRPMLSDLRESGAIEQDADIVIFIYRDEYYHPESEEKNVGEVIIAKQRNGKTGTVKLAWLGEYTLFANLSRSQADPGRP